MLLFMRCDSGAGIGKRGKSVRRNTQEPARSRSIIWHSVMCVLNRKSESERHTVEERERRQGGKSIKRKKIGVG